MVALQNVKDLQCWLRIRNNQLEGNVSLSEYFAGIRGTCMVSITMKIFLIISHQLLFREKVDVSVSSKSRRLVSFIHVLMRDECTCMSINSCTHLSIIKQARLLKQFMIIFISPPDGFMTLESLVEPGHFVGIDSDGAVTSPSEIDASNENAHFTPNLKVYIYHCSLALPIIVAHIQCTCVPIHHASKPR